MVNKYGLNQMSVLFFHGKIQYILKKNNYLIWKLNGFIYFETNFLNIYLIGPFDTLSQNDLRSNGLKIIQKMPDNDIKKHIFKGLE